MKVENCTKKQLLDELKELRERIAELEKLGKEREEITEKLLRELEANKSISNLSKELILSRTIYDISNLVLEQAKQLTKSKFGYVGYIDPRTGYLLAPTLTRDIWESCQVKDKNIVFKEFRGLWGWVLQNHKPILTNEAETDPRASGIPAGHVPIHRFLSAPAIINDTLVGQVAVANSHRNYDERDLELIERLATLYAIAIEHEMSETNYREIFNAANDAIIIHDKNTGAILDFNHKTYEMFGYPLDEGKLLNVGDLSLGIPPYTQEYATPILKEAKNKGPQVFEWLCKDKSGRIFWGEVNLKKAIIRGKECMLSILRDITERKRVDEALRERKEELEIKSRNLEEANTALRVLLKRREEDKGELEGKVLSNVKQLLNPFIEKLKRSNLDINQRGYVEILESNLNDIISSFSTTLSSKYLGLTPTQIKVAELIRLGKTTKEIAELMSLSVRTVETHRKHIRRKVGLPDKRTNLRSRLLSLP